jgi:pilus assembly protein CpaE
VSEITVGILSASPETSASLRTQIQSTGLALVKLEAAEHCASTGDGSTRRFIDCAPDFIIVDMQQRTPALKSLDVLHSVLPGSWLLASSDNDDPQLIIESMRAGAREFLPKPVTRQNLQQAFRRYISEREKQTASKQTGRIYCVTSAKSGGGATSVAINVAVTLACAQGAKPAVLDLGSPFGDVAAFLNMKPKFTIVDALSASSRLDSALLDSYTAAAHGVSVLAGPSDFPPARAITVSELEHVIRVASETYTHTFCDLPVSSTGECLQLVLEGCSAILLVVTPDLPSLWRTQRLVRFLQHRGRLEKTHLIVNRSRKADEIREGEIQEAVKHSVFWKLPDDYPACMNAVNSGKPLAADDGSELSRSYRELARRLTGAALPEKRRGLLNFFSQR